jgi:DNA repair exonuclease SbcCD ATPase subunit
MIIKRLYIKNFLSVGNNPIEIIFDNLKNIVLIKGSNKDTKGSNGSGKSVIIEAMMFALSGKTLRKLTNEGIVNNFTGKDCHIEIEYDNVKIIRTIKPNTVKLFVDNIERTAASSVETKKLIDQTVGLNFETLASILVFGQHNIISFLDAGEPEKREIIENLMNLKEYNVFEEKARKLLRDTKEQVNVLTAEHNAYESNYTSQNKLLSEQQNKLNLFKTQINSDILQIEKEIGNIPDLDHIKMLWKSYDEQIAEKSTLEAKLLSINNELSDINHNINALNANKQKEAESKHNLLEIFNKAKLDLDSLEVNKYNKWNELGVPKNNLILQKEKQLSDLESQYNSLLIAKPPVDYLASTKILENDINSKKQQIKDITNKTLSKGTCPTCYGEVDPNNSLNVIETIKNSLLVLETELDSIQKNNAELLSNFKQLNEKQVQTAFDEINALKAHINEEKEYIAELKQTLKDEYIVNKDKCNVNIEKAQTDLDAFDKLLEEKYSIDIQKNNKLKEKLLINITEIKVDLQLLAHINKPNILLEDVKLLENKKQQLVEKKQLKQQELLNNNYFDVIKSIENHINEIKNNIEQSLSNIKSKEKDCIYYDFWVKGMGKNGIKSFVVDQIVPTLNNQINFWLDVIYSGSISVFFDKFFNVIIKNNSSGHEMVFGQGSGGERRRIDIAIMLAFRQVMNISCGKDINVLCLDEICDTLDDSGVYRVYETILELSKNNKVLIITHNPTLLNLLTNADSIHIEKENGISRLVN